MMGTAEMADMGAIKQNSGGEAVDGNTDYVETGRATKSGRQLAGTRAGPVGVVTRPRAR